jgi:hypothetical protein
MERKFRAISAELVCSVCLHVWVAKIDDGFQVKLDRHNSRRRWRPSEGLNLVKTGYLILGQVKHSGAAGQIETLRDDWSSFAERISGVMQGHRAKEYVPEGSRDELPDRVVQRYSGQHKAYSLGQDECLRGETALDFADQVSDSHDLAPKY